jgi:hypothetical protein
MGDDVNQAVDLVMAIGPAGELIRLATGSTNPEEAERAHRLRPKIEEALREAYSEFVGPDGARGTASTWIVGAVNPAG